jgi:hypothetical protein
MGCTPDFHRTLSATAVDLAGGVTVSNRRVNSVGLPSAKRAGQAGIAELVKSAQKLTGIGRREALNREYRARASERNEVALLFNHLQHLRRAYRASAEQAPLLRGFYEPFWGRVLTMDEELEPQRWLYSHDRPVGGPQRPVYGHPFTFGGLSVRIVDAVLRTRLPPDRHAPMWSPEHLGYKLVDAVVELRAPAGLLRAGVIGGGHLVEDWEGNPHGTTVWADRLGSSSCPPIPSQLGLPRWNGGFREAAGLPPRVAVRAIGRGLGSSPLNGGTPSWCADPWCRNAGDRGLRSVVTRARQVVEQRPPIGKNRSVEPRQVPPQSGCHLFKPVPSDPRRR